MSYPLAEVFRPSSSVGKFYARARNAAAPLAEIGNVLEATISHDEDVDKTPDMTRAGGGTYAELRRIKQVSLKLKLSDFNATNLARHLRGTISAVDAGSVSDVTYMAWRGGLIATPHVGITAVTVKAKTGGATIAAAGNYEVRPEGIYILPTSTDITAPTEVLVSYSYGDQALLEALSAAPAELELRFGGLNEAMSGKPVVLDIYRASAGLTKNLLLVSSKLMEMEIECEILSDPTKTGEGISRFYSRRWI